MEASGGHTLLIINVWFSMQEDHTDLQSLLLLDSFDIVAITETCSTPDHELRLRDYNVYRKDRQGKRGGGVLLAVKSHLTCLRRRDLETEVETLVCRNLPKS